MLEIKGNNPSDSYYTLDGTDPTDKSIVCTGPIEMTDASYKENRGAARIDLSVKQYSPPNHLVEKANIIKACSYNANDEKSGTSTAIYFINGLYDVVSVFGGEIPVLSLDVTAPF